MDKNQELLEILGILQEECAEAIQIASKIRRFGLDVDHWKEGGTNRDRLENEIGDVMAMIDLLFEKKIISIDNINQFKIDKREKLKKWSQIENL